MTSPIPAILEAIRNRQGTILLSSHTRPDGDSIGSLLGLALALEGAGLKPAIRCEDPVPAKYRFLPHVDLIRDADTPCTHPVELAVVLDCGDFDRIGRVSSLIPEGTPVINIDHHASNTEFGDIVWLDHSAAATGELIFELLEAGAYPISRDSAVALFTAIITDTGSFQYAQTTARTFRVGARLLEAGVNPAEISEQLYMQFSRERVRLLCRLLGRLNFECGGRFCYAWLDAELFRKTGAKREETEGLIDHLRSIDGVVVAAILERLPNGQSVRLSMRSKHQDIDVSKIAMEFQGGGHSAAAGATLDTPSPDLENKLIRHVCEKIDQANLWPRD